MGRSQGGSDLTARDGGGTNRILNNSKRHRGPPLGTVYILRSDDRFVMRRSVPQGRRWSPSPTARGSGPLSALTLQLAVLQPIATGDFAPSERFVPARIDVPACHGTRVEQVAGVDLTVPKKQAFHSWLRSRSSHATCSRADSSNESNDRNRAAFASSCPDSHASGLAGIAIGFIPSASRTLFSIV